MSISNKWVANTVYINYEQYRFRVVQILKSAPAQCNAFWGPIWSFYGHVPKRISFWMSVLGYLKLLHITYSDYRGTVAGSVLAPMLHLIEFLGVCALRICPWC